MIEARYKQILNSEKVQCLLCPHRCCLKDGQKGICNVRENIAGNLYSLNYGKISSLHLDPLEKKPLYHFYPGRQILSVGSVGCNLKCSFCQNCEISQWGNRSFDGLQSITPEQLIQISLKYPDNIGIAYTYNEPVVFTEYVLDSAILAIEQGLKNIMVSNGYILEEPLKDILPIIHAFNIDLKAFDDVFYKKITAGSLAPVLKCLEAIRKAGKHLEITNLIIPELNDDPAQFEEMIKWISGQLGPDTVLHLSRYFPRYKMNKAQTPANTMQRLYISARKHLHYVYMGNIDSTGGQNTVCPKCGETLIERSGYKVALSGITSGNCCYRCGNPISIVI